MTKSSEHDDYLSKTIAQTLCRNKHNELNTEMSYTRNKIRHYRVSIHRLLWLALSSICSMTEPGGREAGFSKFGVYFPTFYSISKCSLIFFLQYLLGLFLLFTRFLFILSFGFHNIYIIFHLIYKFLYCMILSCFCISLKWNKINKIICLDLNLCSV